MLIIHDKLCKLFCHRKQHKTAMLDSVFLVLSSLSKINATERGMWCTVLIYSALYSLNKKA